MSKIAIVTDVHIGVRNASQTFAEFQLKFFEESFFPHMKKNKIDTVLCCGDLFDTRKFSNHVILDMWNKRFFDYMEKEGITFHLILGNHDLALRNSLEINSPTLFLSKYKNVIIYDKPTEVSFDGTDVILVPWICSSNYAETLSAVKKSKAQIMFGHLELANFEMHKGQVQHEGMDAKLFSRFEAVYSGHYHHRSSSGNINYLGCPMEFTWIDYNDPKGFHIFDPKKREMKFHKNPFTMFNKVFYDDKKKPDNYWKTLSLDGFENTYVKVVVVNKTDPYQFDRFLDKCYNANLSDLKIIEDFSDIDSDSVDDEDLELEDTMSLTDTYIDSIDVVGDKDKLKSLMKSLYTEALEVVD
jgi:DNA repair exonuclease SbcCD nuclease subunit